MNTNLTIIDGVMTLLGAVLSILVIIVWTNKRDSVWWFIMSAVLVYFLGNLYNVLASIGILSWDIAQIHNVSFLKPVFDTLPVIFMIIAMIFKLVHINRSWD
ncbi:hypothetical protein [Spirochaeta cellobiosiphila]|uniref:hypothetical protein n=1 Tax=Spirochaeta cellobiosiphila TaxID=504483 RepID=UPI00048E1AC0|nr:hypothetical protein [Spirochaeta cellobiosiphila]